jgi:hypothetical protein
MMLMMQGADFIGAITKHCIARSAEFQRSHVRDVLGFFEAMKLEPHAELQAQLGRNRPR